jgi:hypothetical protein
MKNIISYTLLIIFMVGLLVNPGNVFAQTTLPSNSSFALIDLDIRPEFDNTQVLVIYHIILRPDTKLPASITFRLPVRVGSPNAVAWVDPADGNLYNLTYQSRIDTDTLYITFTTTGNEIQLEYYDPSLIKDGTHRDFTYEWPGDFNVDSFNVNIQQPLGATNTLITPDMGTPQKNDNGVDFYFASMGKISAGNDFKINIKYDKSTDAISAEQLPVQPSEPINSATTGRTTIAEVLPWIVGLLLIIIAGMVGWLFWNARNTGGKKSGRGRRHSVTIKAQKDDHDEYVYCHQCGQRAENSDLFCRTCGTKLRRV